MSGGFNRPASGVARDDNEACPSDILSVVANDWGRRRGAVVQAVARDRIHGVVAQLRWHYNLIAARARRHRDATLRGCSPAVQAATVSAAMFTMIPHNERGGEDRVVGRSWPVYRVVDDGIVARARTMQRPRGAGMAGPAGAGGRSEQREAEHRARRDRQNARFMKHRTPPCGSNIRTLVGRLAGKVQPISSTLRPVMR